MTDIEIAHKAAKLPIGKVAKKIGLSSDELILYGDDKAKINKIPGEKKGKLILVTATNPTPYGEGKTTVSIGLADALNSLNKNVLLALREPSLGPVFGMKGGATGGGYSQIVPMEDINLFFTGDMSAIEAANNLLCAAIDNHIYFGNRLGIEKIAFQRCLDVNDRTLRNITANNRSYSFTITAASEIMALLCLANDLDDLREKIGNIVIGYNANNEMIYARSLHIEGAMLALLKDAFKPNLVQTLENTPAIVHGGPFANIAHGCNSLNATRLALSLGDYVLTEAGFGSDLGAEKFFDIKCRKGNIAPDCVVIVTTLRSLKYNAHVPKSNINLCDVSSVKSGLSNLQVHIENMKKFNSNIIVALNRFSSDTVEEIEVVKNFCKNLGVAFSMCDAYSRGSAGALDLAEVTLGVLDNENNFKLLYDDNLSIKEKIEKISTEIYRANDVLYTDIALEKIAYLTENNMGNLPICVAKTQYSLSDDKNKIGITKDHIIHVKDIKVYSGAGFIVVYLGNIIDMPGLPKEPNYLNIDVLENEIIGLS